jgi:glycosyltransferase involved in cell wall biosynthesis
VTTVLLDVRRATWRPDQGLSRYARNLVEAVRALAPPDIRLVPLDVAGSPHWRDMSPVAVGRGHSLGARMLQEQWGMARAGAKADLLHLPWYEGPARPGCPLVVSVHDLDTLERPDGYRWRFRAYYNSLLRLYVRTARRILVPSRASLESLEQRWPGRPYVHVPLGVDARFFSQPAEAATQPARTILYPGGFGIRKRLPDLVAAFERVAEKDGDVRLVVTGAPDGDDERLLRSGRFASRVDLVGSVSEDRLAELYRDAAVVAYPSEGEGFGFPVLEAFASGTPVVACDSGSVPEVAGGAALLVPPRRPGDLADALASVLSDAGLRDRLCTAGRERAQAFSWKQVAARTLDVYREAVA